MVGGGGAEGEREIERGGGAEGEREIERGGGRDLTFTSQ